jgi:hypothetical protein
MFGRKRKRAAEQVDSIRAARLAQERADRVIEHVQAQQPEVDERVGRLNRRGIRNGFGEALHEAMERRRPA